MGLSRSTWLADTMSYIQEIDTSANLMRALLWQHEPAKRLEALVTAKQTWYNTAHTKFWSDWIRDVFDLRTANAFGLQVWAIILGLPLGVAVDPSDPAKPAWGFKPHNRNFGRGNFSSQSSTTVGLTLEQQRLMLQLRYFQLTSRCTVPELNRILAYVFRDQGQAYVLDGNDMSFVVYVFKFVPDSQFAFLLEQYDVLPRPAGVGVRYVIDVGDYFGFGEFNGNFDNYTFKD